MDALPYGSWPSPLTAEAVTAAAPRLDGARFAGEEIWWGESVPDEGGRVAVRRRRADGTIETVLPAPWNARSSVHEYGGGAWTVTDDGELVFVERADGRLWACRPDERPRPLTPEDPAQRYGGLRWQSARLLGIRETQGEARNPRREIVAVPLDGSAAADPSRIDVLAGGADFLAQPALSSDGRRLAWIEWDHPAMPWDRTRLCVRELGADAVTLVDRGTAPLQPEWDGESLLFADDPDGRWNLFRMSDGAPAPLSPADADTGGALWVLGARWYGVLADGRVLAVRTDGASRLVVIDADGAATDLGLDLTAGVAVEDVRGTRALVIGAGATTESAVWLVDVDAGSAEPVTASAAPWDRSWLPTPREITVDGPHGPVHAIDYAPKNPRVAAPAGELPPYLVWVHGGPTSQAQPAASAKVAYFTSRGIGVLDVNYGGSTGYGRAYRERLLGQWGVVDVDDVAAAAEGLAASGAADPDRLAIEGGSAGGWTVLAALVNTDVFAAGVSRYGVGDARTLAEDTHDFESRYLDALIGPLPEAEDMYIERSPLSHPERFRVPLLILQGEEDAVVPPAQAEAIRAALSARGVPYGYVLYPGEGHGFRRRETVVHALESELAFLGEVFGFATPDVPPFPLTVGAITSSEGAHGRELVIAPGAAASDHGDRDVATAVSREPVRPLYVRTPDAAWAAVFAAHGFTPVDESGLAVLLPALDGA
ncbi:prolyl oligopeptidase family serine peptidase [Microbacterium sp. SORGH_AS_0888]|uniref:S9 family peptidase n=1 Tax=Microbacterium sp. SORGH_AS_0888 TaxID=3041791 RepID=UPI00278267A0|nr:prolyl oligopeptidase family serine peptidase [Microbacterium sp. SORGH_AS_0888]MDQ1129074.1 dipeptidyl aminopeptidase/acylaminoacyl peptidase [Microbacterium sp. SORGH_AS_0888]